MPTPVKRERLTIDLLPEEHRKIKAYAALHGKSLREYVMECLKEQMRQEAEEAELLKITRQPTSLLWEIWDNEKDAAYDQI